LPSPARKIFARTTAPWYGLTGGGHGSVTGPPIRAGARTRRAAATGGPESVYSPPHPRGADSPRSGEGRTRIGLQPAPSARERGLAAQRRRADQNRLQSAPQIGSAGLAGSLHVGVWNGIELDGLVLTSERLTLRPLLPSDADAVHRAMQDRRMHEFLPLPDPYTPADALEYVTVIGQQSRHDGTGFECALVATATGQLAGTAAIRLPPARRAGAEIDLPARAGQRGMPPRRPGPSLAGRSSAASPASRSAARCATSPRRRSR
jgi:hypothetical protein